MDCPTREDLFRIAADEALARSQARTDGRQLSPEEIYTEGSDANIMCAAMSAMGDEVMRASIKRMTELLMSTAEGDALDRVVADRFNGEVPRLEASPSVGDAQVVRDLTLSAAALVVPAETLVRSKSGQVYRTAFPLTFGAGAAGPVTARLQAIETGPQGNVLAGEITAFVTPILGLSIDNEERTAGGDDAEGDDRYRARAARYYASARRGILAAIEFGALRVPGVRLAVAFEPVDELGEPLGYVELFIADASGAGNAALAAAVRLGLAEYRAGGVSVVVYASTPRFVPLELVPRFEPGVDTTLAFEELRRRLVARSNELRPSKVLERSFIYDVGRSITGLIVRDDFVREPAGDIVPALGETLRLSAATITQVVP